MKKAFFFIILSFLFLTISTSLTSAEITCNLQDDDWWLCEEIKPGFFNTTIPTIVVQFWESMNIESATLVYIEDLQGQVPAGIPDYNLTQYSLGNNKYNYTANAHLDDGVYEFIINSTNNKGVVAITVVKFKVNVSAMPIWVSKPTNNHVEKPDFAVSTTNNFYMEIESSRNSMCKYSRTVAAGDKTLKQNYIDFPFSFNHNLSNEKKNYLASFDINDIQSGYDTTKGTLLPIYVICNETESERYSYKTLFVAVDSTPPVINPSSDPQPIISYEQRKTNLSITTSDLSVCNIIHTNHVGSRAGQGELSFLRGAQTTFNSFNNFTKNYSEIVTVFSDPSNYNYTLNITCENLANVKSSQTYTINANLDITESFQFLENKPPAFLNSTNVNITGSVVNQYTLCDYILDNSTTYKPLQNTGGFIAGRVVLSASDTAPEGDHKIYVNCTGFAQTVQKNFKVDITPPDLNIIADPQTCSVSKIELEFNVTDPKNGSGPAFVHYNISFDGKIINDIVGIVNAGSSSIVKLSKQIPQGLEGYNFTVKAKPQDSAGNLGQEKTSQKVMVTNSSLLVCDKTPPQIILNESKNTATKEWTIRVNCTDYESGCKGEFKYSTHIEANASCSFAFTKNLLDPIVLSNSTRLCLAVFDNNNNNKSISKLYEVNYPLYCYNDIKDINETAIDCGGNCPACGLNSTCSINSDCTSNYCHQGICKEASCSDNIKNGLETFKDCGGSVCPACELGETCILDSDCSSRNCNNNKCDQASCENNKKDGAETGTDCGGPLCQKCELGIMCLANADCTSGYCGSDKRCAVAQPQQPPASTKDGIGTTGLIFIISGSLLLLGGLGMLAYPYIRDNLLNNILGENTSTKKEKMYDDAPAGEDIPEPESILDIKKLTPEQIRLRQRNKKDSEISKKSDRKRIFDEFGESANKSPVKEEVKTEKQDKPKLQKESTKEKPEPLINKENKEYIELSEKKDSDVFSKLEKLSKAKKSKK